MRLTNNLGLPQAIVDAVSRDPYRNDADISITGLIAPARQRVLRKQHDAEITEDVSERIYALLGQVMHGILERANKAALAEQRFFLDVEGTRVSGALDAIYEDGVIQDYKLLSYHKVSNGVPSEFEEQLNMYVALVRHGRNKDGKTISEILGKEVRIRKLELVCIFRDWSKGKAEQNDLMPQQQGLKLDVMLWSDEDQMAFLTERVRAHKDAEKTLPDCTDHERWKKEDRWAVMPKRGAARAMKLHNSREDAEAHAKKVGGTAFVEERRGEPIRCRSWCNVSEVCTQWSKERGVLSSSKK